MAFEHFKTLKNVLRSADYIVDVKLVIYLVSKLDILSMSVTFWFLSLVKRTENSDITKCVWRFINYKMRGKCDATLKAHR